MPLKQKIFIVKPKNCITVQVTWSSLFVVIIHSAEISTKALSVLCTQAVRQTKIKMTTYTVAHLGFSLHHQQLDHKASTGNGLWSIVFQAVSLDTFNFYLKWAHIWTRMFLFQRKSLQTYQFPSFIFIHPSIRFYRFIPYRGRLFLLLWARGALFPSLKVSLKGKLFFIPFINTKGKKVMMQLMFRMQITFIESKAKWRWWWAVAVLLLREFKCAVVGNIMYWRTTEPSIIVFFMCPDAAFPVVGSSSFIPQFACLWRQKKGWAPKKHLFLCYEQDFFLPVYALWSFCLFDFHFSIQTLDNWHQVKIKLSSFISSFIYQTVN